MEFKLDFQSFENENNEFIIKEFAVVSTSGERNELHLFRLPYQLPHGLKMQVRWLEKCFRGLYWNYGLKDFRELSNVLINIFKLALVVLRIFCSSVFANDARLNAVFTAIGSLQTSSIVFYCSVQSHQV